MSRSGLVPAAEAARRLGLSERRIRALISSGWLEGSKQAGRWFVDLGSLDRWNSSKPVAGRPLSPQNAWAALLALEGREARWLSPWDKSRLRSRLYLRRPNDWLPRVRNRASLHRLHGHPGVIDQLSKEPWLVLSGISAAPDYGLDVFPRHELEAYVPAQRLERLKRKYRLGSSERPNVFLRSVDEVWPFARNEKVAPAAVVAIDLLDSEDQRSRRAGTQLWNRVMEQAREHAAHSER